MTPPKYPRIPHLFGTRDPRAHDRILPPVEAAGLLADDVTVEEKLDGANVVLWRGDDGEIRAAGRGGPGAMDRAGQLGRLRAWIGERHRELDGLLDEETALYGEWLYLTHGIHYDHLPDLLVGIDLWNAARGFLPVLTRDARLRRAGVATPPSLFRGIVGSRERLEELLGTSAFGSTPAEGLIVRRLDPRSTQPRAKLVAPGFLQVDDTTPSSARWRPNGLRAPARPRG